MDNKAFLQDLYEELPLPFLISSKDGLVLYRNKALFKEFPACRVDNSLSLIFPVSTVKTILACEKPEEFFLVGLNVNMTVIPHREYICILLLKKNDSSLNDRMMSSLLLPVPHIFRTSISNMLHSVSSIYAIGEEKEDERLMELSKELNLSCYKILRGNNLISSYCRELMPGGKDGEKIDLTTVLKTVAEAARVIVNDLDIELNLNIPEAVVPVLAEENSLVEAILALIDNACKYSSSKEPVSVKLSVVGKNAVITVSDKGIGIPNDVMPHIFEPYYSFDREAEPLSGVGLGLTLARLTAVKWGGNVTVSSKDYEGTTAVMTLPVLKGEKELELNSKVTLTHLLRDRFSPLHVMLADNNTVPLP